MSRQATSTFILTRRLFFQLLKIELADKHDHGQACKEYNRLSLMLADQRRLDDTLPDNPEPAYVRRNREGLHAKLVDEDRQRYEWFSKRATLEQLVELMALP